jgi:hypothetical protein
MHAVIRCVARNAHVDVCVAASGVQRVGTPPPANPVACQSRRKAVTRFYTVAEGETWQDIGSRTQSWDTTLVSIQSANKIDGSQQLVAGQLLEVPGCIDGVLVPLQNLGKDALQCGNAVGTLVYAGASLLSGPIGVLGFATGG